MKEDKNKNINDGLKRKRKPEYYKKNRKNNDFLNVHVFKTYISNVFFGLLLTFQSKINRWNLLGVFQPATFISRVDSIGFFQILEFLSIFSFESFAYYGAKSCLYFWYFRFLTLVSIYCCLTNIISNGIYHCI